jgi:hypothetical protein
MKSRAFHAPFTSSVGACDFICVSPPGERAGGVAAGGCDVAGGVVAGGVVVVCAIAEDDIRSAAQAARTEAFIGFTPRNFVMR